MESYYLWPEFLGIEKLNKLRKGYRKKLQYYWKVFQIIIY